MTWSPFSAEAVELSGVVRRLQKDGRISEVLSAIEAALVKAHEQGPSNISYEQFEANDRAQYAASLSDRELRAAHHRTDGKPGNPEADALAAELQRRNVDV